jgi:hypothetical protein
MKKTYYHAVTMDKMVSIMKHGLLRNMSDTGVYFTDDAISSLDWIKCRNEVWLNRKDKALGLVIFDEYISATNSTYDDKIAYTSLPSNQRHINTGVSPYYQWITAVEVMSPNNQTSFTTQLNKLNTVNFPLGDGIGTPEPSDMGVDLVALQSFGGAFRNNVARLVVVITPVVPVISPRGPMAIFCLV